MLVKRAPGIKQQRNTIKRRALCIFVGIYSGPWFNIKVPSYQYRKSHCGDKTVVRSSYLHNGISYTDKMVYFYWISPLVIIASNNGQSSVLRHMVMRSCLFKGLPFKTDHSIYSVFIHSFQYHNNLEPETSEPYVSNGLSRNEMHSRGLWLSKKPNMTEKKNDGFTYAVKINQCGMIHSFYHFQRPPHIMRLDVKST